MEEMLLQETINIITDHTSRIKKIFIFRQIHSGSFGQFEGALSGTKSLENISVTGNSNYIVSDGYRRNNALRQKTGNLGSLIEY